MAYSIYSLTTTVAYASDQSPSTNTCPSPANPPTLGTDVVKPKPGFKLVPAAKSAVIGKTTSVCSTILQSGDFIYGLLCGLLLVGIGWLNNRE